MPITIQRYTEEDVESFKSLLQSQQDTTPPKKLTTRQAVLQLKPELERLNQQGWGWTDIVELLAERNMSISVKSLRESLKPIVPKKNPLKPLKLTDLLEIQHTEDLTVELNKRNKVTLCRFLKSVSPQQQESATNKMRKEDLIKSIAHLVAGQTNNTNNNTSNANSTNSTNDNSTKQKPASTLTEKKAPPKKRERPAGEHDDLFNIDLGI